MGIAVAAVTMAIGGVGSAVLTAAIDGATPETQEIPATAYLGETFDVPDYYHLVNGERVKAEVRILTPDGTLYAKERLDVEQIGEYTVQYLVDGDVVSTVSCVALRRPCDMFSVNKYAEIQGIATYAYSQNPAFSGVKAEVRAGAEIVFERELDMTQRTKDETLLQMLVSPSMKGERDFGQFILTFTDVMDENITMTLIASDGNLDSASGSATSYVRAGGNGQTLYGREYKGGAWIYNDTDIYGSPAPFSFEATHGVITDYALNLCYDTQENALYLKNGNGAFFGDSYQIIDFDSTAVYGTNVWNGFPSGKAKLTVTFDKFVKDSGYVIFSQIDGIDLSQERIVDNEPPTIAIDLQGEENAPNSYKGAKYSVFPATAKDFYDAERPVAVEVKYTDLLSENCYDVPVADGAFITDKVGKYEIIYRAKDCSGNESEASVFFYCFNDAEEIVVALDEENKNAKVFERVGLIPVEEIRTYGGNGKLSLALQVLDPNNQQVAVVNNAFVPEQIGTYTIRYVATDYFGNIGTKEIRLIVAEQEMPIFTDEINLPEVLMAGFTYELPSARAMTCENGATQKADVKIFVDGEEKTGEATFTVPKEKENVVVEYRAYRADGTTYSSWAKTLSVLDGKEGKNQAAYFYNADGKIQATQEKNAIKLSFAESGSVFFINKLNRNAFSLNASYQPQTTNFASMTLTLKDSADATKTVSAKITFTPMGLNITLAGKETAVFASRTDTKASYFAFSYDNAQRKVSDINGNDLFVITKDDNGNDFDGFTDGVYMTLYFDGVKTNSELSLTSMNNQAFGYKNSEDDPIGDTVAPQIIVNGEFTKRCEQGDEITVFSADAFDVLGQVKALTLSVYAPDNTVILNRVPTDRDYTFTAEQIGRYRVIYESTDSYGNSKGGNTGTNIVVLDAQAPTLSVNGALKKVYRVGDTVSLLGHTLQDNTGTALLDVFLELPSNEMRLLVHYENDKKTSYPSMADGTYPNAFKVNENAFRLETAGKYRLIYFAYDSAYNYVMRQFEFTVVE